LIAVYPRPASLHYFSATLSSALLNRNDTQVGSGEAYYGSVLNESYYNVTPFPLYYGPGQNFDERPWWQVDAVPSPQPGEATASRAVSPMFHLPFAFKSLPLPAMLLQQELRFNDAGRDRGNVEAPFPGRVTLVSDGRCGSACCHFVARLKHHVSQRVETVFVGGITANASPPMSQYCGGAVQFVSCLPVVGSVPTRRFRTTAANATIARTFPSLCTTSTCQRQSIPPQLPRVSDRVSHPAPATGRRGGSQAQRAVDSGHRARRPRIVPRSRVAGPSSERRGPSGEFYRSVDVHTFRADDVIDSLTPKDSVNICEFV
jgi:hypothetical protein